MTISNLYGVLIWDLKVSHISIEIQRLETLSMLYFIYTHTLVLRFLHPCRHVLRVFDEYCIILGLSAIKYLLSKMIRLYLCLLCSDFCRIPVHSVRNCELIKPTNLSVSVWKRNYWIHIIFSLYLSFFKFHSHGIDWYPIDLSHCPND